jgi:2-polyprenyl-3-methyl-5-hydroxy-6-metoxy-1,4-benzoquinol methylase
MTPLGRLGAHVIGLDLSLEMLRVAHAGGAQVVQADMARPLPFRSGVFDGLISVREMLVA